MAEGNGKRISSSTGIALGLVVILLAVVGTSAIAWGKMSERIGAIGMMQKDINEIKVTIARIETRLEEQDN